VLHDHIVAPDVLIVGAGPTGLVLALWLSRLGIRVRIVDKTAEPGTTSRALAVHARTLEWYRQLGFADDIVARGRKMSAVNLWTEGSRVAHAELGDIGAGISPFPFVLIFPQDEHERVLIERLHALGVDVERQTEVLGFDESGDGVRVRIKRPGGAVETCEAAYLAGCDGAHSVVRQTLDVGFPGGTYQHLFYVADVEASGAAMNGELHAALDEADFLAVFPLKEPGHVRLVGIVAGVAENRDDFSWDDVSTRVIRWMRIDVARVHWFSTYRVHHRVADRFRDGRAFLLGDAAHIHSPVGGQGMNTGIGDAVNLSWKLAAVLRGRAASSILDTYEPERIAFARRLVATTDQAFAAVTSNDWLARRARLSVVPALLPRLFRIRAARRFMFRTVSQTLVTYRGSSLSAGRAGAVQGGDRLPWVAPPVGAADNFAPLTSLDWQVHVYGRATDDIRAVCRGRFLALHEWPWRDACGRAGLARDAVYLVRPDGYVGLVEPGPNIGAVVTYLDDRRLTMTAGG
jgi:2-polyprenyl-6-methoxyphenol hydroxylase-like FAD-dependent oxidoreductase